jgi:hypothetical protein
MKLSSVAAITAITATVTQLFYGLVFGGFSAGSQLESLQTEVKLLRKDLQSQYEVLQAQNQLYEYRLQRLEQNNQPPRR